MCFHTATQLNQLINKAIYRNRLLSKHSVKQNMETMEIISSACLDGANIKHPFVTLTSSRDWRFSSTWLVQNGQLFMIFMSVDWLDQKATIVSKADEVDLTHCLTLVINGRQQREPFANHMMALRCELKNRCPRALRDPRNHPRGACK